MRKQLAHKKQIVRYLKGEIDKKTIIVDFNNPLTSVNKSSGLEIYVKAVADFK